ncbi:MAG: ureidoglycolate lyase [Gammaproteobacteria bacterium]|nr:ureidoglycolate lyase [Gammaproteobacteria bacterium]NKB62763.1 ureidoglycolate lyase [Gammaproteobacteria bacterium]
MELAIKPLTAEIFAPYGEVIELETAKQFPINEGLTTRFHDLCTINTLEQGGKPIVNVFRTDPIKLPHRVQKMERHPLGSQAFIPMDDAAFFVLVGKPGDSLMAQDLTLFITNGRQGINLHKNTWHHFQLCLGERRDFLVIDRGGSGENLEEVEVTGEAIIPKPDQ